ncbi:hypothetical protein MESS2_340012 [Mesorhizobium metallidurans STM 2683]|uniref:Uncharacterized protein n=1 Tax=Mesorhizobium metallidurans STM 2683 TaxID=1297569 RepID=M5F411_9HYPH|nr:hypothetical protein MESS2_340012 [Mesorhizobium metallidurans STM 2683]
MRHTRCWGHKSYANESLTAQNESPFIGHAFLLRARPESSEPGLFPGFCAFCPHFRPFTRLAEALGSVGLGETKGRNVGLE